MKNRVRALRFAAGYKSDSDKDIESFAFYYNTTPENLKMWEAQKGIPNYEFASNLCKHLNVPIEFLYGYVFETKTTPAPLPLELQDYGSLSQDIDQEDPDYQDYILFKNCGGYFKEKFDISYHIGALISTRDIQCAKNDHVINEKDWAISDIIRVITDSEKRKPEA